LPPPALQKLFPDNCSLQIIEEEAGDLGQLFPEERSILSEHAASSVQKLFAAGRLAAKKGMVKLGVTPTAIGRNEDRSPRWPPNICGSISHTQGLAVAVTANKKDIWSLGVDVEREDRKVNARLISKVGTAMENEWFAKLETAQQNLALLRLLSAKEATFKAFYPLERVFLHFSDAEFTPISKGFEGQLLKSASRVHPPNTRFLVLQSVWNGYLFSACHIPQPDPSL
jgi:4'-phosphopantetheinyl transferase EntD